MRKSLQNLDAGWLRPDICIIGAGPAGLTLAFELEKSGIKVLLVEAGGDRLSPDQADYYRHLTGGNRSYDQQACRSRALGGSSNCWEGWCAPFDEEDFESDSNPSGETWPVTYQEIRSYYSRAARRLEIGDDVFQAKEVSAEISEMRNDFYFKLWKFSPPSRFGKTDLPAINSAKNLCLLTETCLTDLRTDGTQNVQRAKLRSKDGFEREIQAKIFVLATGGIENARLLLNFRKDRARGLGNEYDQVGRYFMEHPHIYTATKGIFCLNASERQIFKNFKSDGREYRGFLQLNQTKRRALGIGKVAIRFEQEFEPQDFDWGAPYLAAMREDGAAASSYRCGITLMGEQMPNPESRVTLSEETDPLGLQRPRVNWNVTDYDRRTYHETLSQFSLALGRTHLGRLWIEDKDWFKNDILGGCHHMGTTRMGASDKQSVVDRNLKVHDVGNLFLLGSSVFVTSGTANPTFTIVALSYRLADFLKTKLPEIGS